MSAKVARLCPTAAAARSRRARAALAKLLPTMQEEAQMEEDDLPSDTFRKEMIAEWVGALKEGLECWEAEAVAFARPKLRRQLADVRKEESDLHAHKKELKKKSKVAKHEKSKADRRAKRDRRKIRDPNFAKVERDKRQQRRLRAAGKLPKQRLTSKWTPAPSACEVRVPGR